MTCGLVWTGPLNDWDVTSHTPFTILDIITYRVVLKYYKLPLDTKHATYGTK